MEHLIEMAKKLGEQIAAHERTALLQKAQQEINEDPEAIKLIEEYQQQAIKIQELEKQQKPIEVEDKHKLQELEQGISSNAKLVELTRRQVDFVEMMRKVKENIDGQLQWEKGKG